MPDPAFRPDPDAQWEALLRQLRQQSAAQPVPFVYARVNARLLAKARAPLFQLPPWLRRPAYAVALGLLMLAVSGDGAATAPGSHPAYPAPRVLP